MSLLCDGQYNSGTPHGMLFSLANSRTIIDPTGSGNQSYTVECFFKRLSTTANQSRMFAFDSYNNGRNLSFSWDGGTVNVDVNSTADPRRISSNSVGSTVDGNWHHLAISYNYSTDTIRAFYDGVSIGSSSGYSNFIKGSNLKLGLNIGGEPDSGYSSTPFHGHITNFRVVVGSALYTSNFTPSTTPLTSITGTTLLIKPNNAGNAMIDTSSNSYTPISLLGTSYSTDSPFPSGGGGGGGGGGAGDPYVTTIKNISYKLPIMDANIRFYQGMVNNKLLTINASLKTISSNEMIAENLHSFLKLKDCLNSKQVKQIMKNIFEKNELLSFFEKIFISYDNNEIILNVWNQKFEVENYKGSFKTSAVHDMSLLEKSTNLYGKYKGQTLKIEADCANIYISVYDAPIVRSGIYVEAPNMENGNGVIVNTCSPSSMSIDSLISLLPIERNDSGSKKTIKEFFIDAEGYRVREIITFT